jgi:hypothetical protein
MERMRALAATWTPRTSTTALIETAMEEFLAKHERKVRSDG